MIIEIHNENGFCSPKCKFNNGAECLLFNEELRKPWIPELNSHSSLWRACYPCNLVTEKQIEQENGLPK
jgi:hypothetical protein